MKRNSMMVRRAAMSAFIVATSMATTGLVMTTSFAQPPAGGGGGGRRGGGQRGGQQLTVGSVPASALAIGLKLTDDQKTKVDAAQKPLMDLQKTMTPTPGQQPDRAAMQANYQKMGEMRTKADADVTAILTDDQKAALPEFLKKLGELQRAGIAPGVYGDLKLSGDQETQILDISTKAQRKMRDAMQAQQDSGAQPDRTAMMTMYQDAQKDTKTKVEAVLTASQKLTLEEYDKAHPQRGMGGMGGGRMGGGGGGRRGGGGGAAGGGAPAGGGNL